jgi:putative transposase
MAETRLRKAYKYKLTPTPEQARQLELVLWRCRTLYNTALEERITAYRRCGACRPEARRLSPAASVH